MQVGEQGKEMEVTQRTQRKRHREHREHREKVVIEDGIGAVRESEIFRHASVAAITTT
jgi:hypothetical protein